MLNPLKAWIIAACLGGIFYISALAYLIPRVRRYQQLKSRVNRHGNKAIDGWQELTRMDVKKLKRAKIESRVQELFRSNESESWTKDLQHLFYRSGALRDMRSRSISLGIVSILLAFLGFQFVYLSPFLALVIGFFLSLMIHFIQLRLAAKAWQKKFVKIFPQSLDIIIRALRSGLTLGRGIAMVSEEMEDPIGTEFHYIVSQLQLGIPPDFAFREASDRIGVDDFRVFAIALIIQREMGGSLTDILTKLSDVVRERDKFRGKVWTMSSEARTTAMIVGALPLLTALGIEMISPGYLRFFIADEAGIKMLTLAISLNVMGIYIISRMIKFES